MRLQVNCSWIIKLAFIHIAMKNCYFCTQSLNITYRAKIAEKSIKTVIVTCKRHKRKAYSFLSFTCYMAYPSLIIGKKLYSCTPDRNCHTFCLGDKIASHPGVLTQAKKITQNLEINQILGVVVQEKESNMVFCSRWKFPTLGMTVLSGTSAEPRFRSARSSLGL